MYLEESNISCGVMELDGVGMYPSEAHYNEAMQECNAAIVVASVPSSWKQAVKFLKRKGFKQVHREIRNPNSGNKIVLLSRSVTEKDRRAFRGNFCRDCDGEIPKGRRVCDDCKYDRRHGW